MYHLLIVDDEPLTRDFFLNNVSSIDPEWCVDSAARDGAEALEYLADHHVDLIITDIKMPSVDGLELCEKVKAQKPNQEIIILSGYNDFTYAQEALHYHVHGYLLKPVKISEVKNALHEVAARIDQSSKQEIAFMTMQNLSVDYQSHICRNYLRAIIEDQNTEIKVLHPMLYKLKIDLMQALGIIMIFRLDVESLLTQKMPPEDLTIFRYILFQATTEFVEEDASGYVILDSDENTVSYLTCDSEQEIIEKCGALYSKVSGFLKTYTGLTVTGFMGCAKSEILEMALSYQEAKLLYNLWAIRGGNTLYDQAKADPTELSSLKSIDRICSALMTGYMERNDVNIQIAANNLKAFIGAVSAEKSLSFLLLLLQYAMQYKPDFSSEQYISTLKTVVSSLDQVNAEIPADLTVFYLNVLDTIWGTKPEKPDETGTRKLVENAMKYIYQHFSEPITLSQIADNFNVTPNYLSKVFHEETGESYVKFITRIRMEYAANLLRTTPSEHVFAIAEKAGYYNLKHFNYVFKEYYNQTPTEYQKNTKEI